MSEPEFFYDIEQGSEAWFEIRRGIPTASKFQTILSNSEKRGKYLNNLVGELISAQPMETTYQSAAMARGKEMEAEARDSYARSKLLELRLVGFVRRELPSGRFVGCSPDAIFTEVGRDGVLEIKTMEPGLMIEQREAKTFPSKHKAQVQGALWVTGLDRAALTIYYRGMPWSLNYDVKRDEAYIKELESAVCAFDLELGKKLERHSK